ncbi:monovalent cation:proton antiporter-2 (CPA2) family protein [Myxococcota bacterium]|nr:monovalent cation:proton antiporter-2 (CPA2) family protein [Myxococcota bacterium]
MGHDALLQAFVYLGAAVTAVPIAKRLGLGSVLGYLLAGVIIGPYALRLVGERGADVMHAAEFGVVMMLFLIGLELRPALLWELRRPILGLGGAQVLGTSVVLTGAALALGLPMKEAVSVGLILAGSSTAIVLQSLNEKGQMKTEAGRASFAVLLFQDIAVIPMLALFPLLGTKAAEAAEPSRPGWLSTLMVLAAVAGIILAGRFLVRPLFRFLAATGLREVFTAAALLLVVGIALLMELVGVSAALGTFLAGVVLAESEYRRELEGDIEPFKGLLLGLFFISVGVTIDFGLIASSPGLVAGLVLALIALKMLVLYALGRIFALQRSARTLFAFALAQGGEFAFVLTSFAFGLGALGKDTAGFVTAVVAISMLMTPLVLILHDRVVAPRVQSAEPARPHDHVESHEDPVVIAGFGRFGQIVGRLLRAKGIGTTVLDLDPATIDLMRRIGLKAYYGDATRLELLHSAGCATAKVFVLAIDDVEKSIELAELVHRHFPKLKIIARARNRPHYYRLRALGIESVHRETFATSIEVGVATLKALGHGAHEALRAGRSFRTHDERAIEQLTKIRETQGDAAFFAEARRALEEVERLMQAKDADEGGDHAWDDATLRDEILRMTQPPST